MGHFIYQIVFLIILGSRKASGLQCYGGSGAPEQCLGIRGTMTALEDGTTTDGQQVKDGESKTGCLTNTGMTGCIEMLLEGIQTQVCVCTTDFCNGGGGVRVKRGAGTLDETGEADETENSSGGKGGMISGIAGAVALIVIVVCAICCCCKCCNSKSKSTKTNTKTSKNIIFKA